MLTEQTQQRRIVGMSTKMYFKVQDTKAYVEGLLAELANKQGSFEHNVDVFVIPDFLTMVEAAKMAKGSPLLIGAQNCHYEENGAFTGEVSASQLCEAGCKIVELGHAERRRMFGETDTTTALKAEMVACYGMTPLVCIGEQTEGTVESALEECVPQVMAVINKIPKDVNLIFAYEPVWAIGKSEPASAAHVVEVAQGLRELTEKRLGSTRIIYGGSARPGIFEDLIEGVDGLFLGRFAHTPEQFMSAVKEVSETEL